METRRWALFSWAFLTIGILLGGWWSYEVLGWSGVWAWDPVENASLLPWLTGTAYIHSVLVQERRGMLRVWNLSLLVATFSLTILGTFLTRSGVINSVHAFGDGPVGSWLLAFFAVDRRRVARADRLARRPAALARCDRLADLAGGRVPRQQRAVHRVRLHRAARHDLPAARRGVPGSPDRRRCAVLRPVVDADRARAAVPDGRRTGAAVAQGVGRTAPRSGCSGRRGWVRARSCSPWSVGADGWAPLVAFGLGGFAAGSALRQLVLATRRQGLGGLVGRANGGMVVHIGVIIIAVALAASNSFTHSATLDARNRAQSSHGAATRSNSRPSTSARTTDESKRVLAANVILDGGDTYRPATTTYLNIGSRHRHAVGAHRAHRGHLSDPRSGRRRR